MGELGLNGLEKIDFRYLPWLFITMALIKKFIPLIPNLIAREFAASAEGITNNGKHEKDVANFFVENGFPLIKCIIDVKPKSKRAKKEKQEYIMDRKTHSPKALNLPYNEGFYTILQPYSKAGRGAMNPSPDIYLVFVQENRITEWLGIECKSSEDSLRPMWNEHLPRPYMKGNIIYFFSGYDNISKKKMNTLFTSEIFFKDKEFDEKKFWKEVRAAMITIWERDYAADFPKIECNLRQFCGQIPFTSKEMEDMVIETTKFLSTQLNHSASSSLSSSSTASSTT